MMDTISNAASNAKSVFPQAKIQTWKYFQRDLKTNDAVCKQCGIVMRVDANLGSLRLHLQQVHNIKVNKMPDPSPQQRFVKPEQIGPLGFSQRQNQSLRNTVSVNSYGTYNSHYNSQAVNASISNLRANSKYDWLSAFEENISSGEDDVIEEDKDELKFIIHGTQFTDPLKYTEFTRYSNDQLTEIKEQMLELGTLSKIPAMVTLEERDMPNIQQNTDKDSLRQQTAKMQSMLVGRIEDFRQKYQIFEWKPLHKKNNHQVLQINQNNDKVINMQQKQIEQNNNDPEVNQVIIDEQNENANQNNQQNIQKIHEQGKPYVVQNQNNQISLQKQNNQNKDIIQLIQPQNDIIQKLQQLDGNRLYEYLAIKGYTVIEINPHKKQNIENLQSNLNQSHQVLQFGQNNKNTQMKVQQKTATQCSLIINQKMMQLWQSYGQTLCISLMQISETVTVQIIFIQNWRSNLEPVAYLIISHNQDMNYQYYELSYMILFQIVGCPFPNYIWALQKQSKWQNLIQQIFGSLAKKLNIKNVNIKQQLIDCQQRLPLTQSNQNIKNNSVTQQLYYNFVNKLQKVFSKYSGLIKKIDKSKKLYLSSQLLKKNRKHSISNLIENNEHFKNLTKSNQQNLQQYTNPITYKDNYFQGFLQTKIKSNQIKSKLIKCEQQLKQRQNIKRGEIISLLESMAKQIKQLQINKQIEYFVGSTNKQQNVNLVKSIQNKVSPFIYQKIVKIYKQTLNITHFKYILPVLVEVYSAIPNQNQLQHSTINRCIVYKHTLIYNQLDECWQCNCRRIIQWGLPCCHIMKILEVQRNSIQYYIHQRWKPSKLELLELAENYQVRSNLLQE